MSRANTWLSCCSKDVPSFSKMFRDALNEELKQTYLEEGLVASYDIESLVKKITNIIQDKIVEVQLTSLPDVLKKTNYGNVLSANIFLNQKLEQEQTDRINKILNFYGYTNSLGMFSDKLQLQLEPKYPVKLNDFLKQTSDTFLFHIAPIKQLDDIKKIGLIPKPSETNFEHPGNRIYLLWLPGVENKGLILKALAKKLAKDKKLEEKDFVVIMTKHNSRHTYYLDDTATLLNENIIAVFTTNNISPNEFIKIIQL